MSRRAAGKRETANDGDATASYGFTTCMMIAGWLGFLSLRPGDVVAAYTYTMNHHYDHSWYVGHLWSLTSYYLIERPFLKLRRRFQRV